MSDSRSILKADAFFVVLLLTLTMIDDNLLRQACSPLLENPSLAVEDERLGWFVDLCKSVSEKAKEKQMEEEEEEEGEAQGGSMEEEEEEEAPPSPTPLSRDEMRSMLERAETCLRKEDGEGTRSLEEAVRLATCVLDHFPDSARGLRTRGLARAARLSASAENGKEWEEGRDDLVEGCIADLSKAQSIDYDHGAQVALTRAIEVKEEKRRKNMVLGKEHLKEGEKEEKKTMPTFPFAPNGQEGGSVTGNDFQNAMKSMMHNPDVLRTAQEMLKDPATLRSISELAKGMV